MKLFDKFEAIKFYQEDLIFITHNGYLYYIYSLKNKHWIKHSNAGNDHLTVSNYDDVSVEELKEAMNGVYPKSETDFMRLCNPSQLWIKDMLDILKEDFTKYMADSDIYHAIHRFLLDSDICHKSYEAIQKLLNEATANNYSNPNVVALIKELSFHTLGRDIFKRDLGIVDGHHSSSYFWIMPARIIDYDECGNIDSVAEMRSTEISIGEGNVDQYLTPFLYEYFDGEIDANKRRSGASGFEWYLEHNFFTYEQMSHILKDIADTVDALISGKETEYIKKLKIKRRTETYRLPYAKNLSEEVATCNANRPTEEDTELSLVVDFYQRFLYRMEYMMKAGNEKGYDLISFMGP